MHFFNPDKNGEKFKYQLPRQADPTSKPARVKQAEASSTKAEQKKCSSGAGETAQEMGTVITFTILFIAFFPDQTLGYYILRCIGTSLSPHPWPWISF